MKKTELFKKIVDKLEESKAAHICCFVDREALTFSLRCSEEDFFNFLYATCRNVPWAKKVIKDFVKEVDDLLQQDAEDVDDTYLN